MPTPLKRQIGFKAAPNTRKEAVKPAEKKPVAAKIAELPKEYTPEEVVAWINDHPGFKWGWMCDQIGLNKGNFGVTLKSEAPKIKPGMVLKMVSVIKDYGFNH